MSGQESEVVQAALRSLGPPRAAQYVRMSTDHQKYSTANQADAIAAYAQSRNITIVRTYSDEGLSGLGIGWRGGLKALISDVEGGSCDFNCILVYDVSRWGRFQDVDESAYYEFICKRAGITVHYCADEFENDGSLSSVILKNVKRVAAADFSRQLSKKVFLGQSRITRLGFWRGGLPAFGLRRQLINDAGEVRTQLEYGQQKYLQSDRVALVHGPEHEIETVRRIFRALVAEGKYFGEIAADLNAEQIRTTRGQRWTGTTVAKILSNETYTGSLIYNRSSSKLKQRRIENPRDMWIRRNAAFPPVISPDLFAQAQELVRERRHRRTDQEAIDRLAALGREKGRLTKAIIDAASDILSAEGYRRRFRSLAAAYELAGYQPEPRYRRAETRAHYRALLSQIAEEIVAKIKDLGGYAVITSESFLICIGQGCCVSLNAARAVSDGERRIRWQTSAPSSSEADLTLIVRLDASNMRAVAYYLIPAPALMQFARNPVRLSNKILRQACRFDNLDDFCHLCAGVEQGGVS
jgi:DNA invertase Pin-like site-specific DNA recombinase